MFQSLWVPLGLVGLRLSPFHKAGDGFLTEVWLVPSSWESFPFQGGVENLYILLGNVEGLLSLSSHQACETLTLLYLFFSSLLRNPIGMNIRVTVSGQYNFSKLASQGFLFFLG